MGIASWTKKHYVVSADEAATDDITAVEHSIAKWKGLRPQVLSKHGLTVDHVGDLVSDDPDEEFSIDRSTCAMCVLDSKRARACCDSCSYREVHGEICAGREDSPYDVWTETQDPEPMIKALKKVRKALKKKTEVQDNPYLQLIAAAYSAWEQGDKGGYVCDCFMKVSEGPSYVVNLIKDWIRNRIDRKFSVVEYLYPGEYIRSTDLSTIEQTHIREFREQMFTEMREHFSMKKYAKVVRSWE